jgi:hypothetical protein
MVTTERYDTLARATATRRSWTYRCWDSGWFSGTVRGLWDQLEGRDVSGAHDGEVAAVEGGDLGDLEPLCRRHHRGVDCSQWQVLVAPHEFSYSKPVLAGHGLSDQISGSEVSEEADFGFYTEPACQQVGHLGHDQYRHDQRTRVRLEEIERFEVMVVVGVDVGV